MSAEKLEKKEQETLTDCLFKSTLGLKIVEAVLPFVSKHMEEALNTKADYNTLGTDNEKKLKETVYLHGKLGTVIKDVEKTIGFLRLKDRKIIKEYYPLLEDDRDYYNYFFENYLIRVASIPDALGILANHINEWGYKHCYGTIVVQDSKNKVSQDEKNVMSRLLEKIEVIRKKRHKKVHEGETDIDYLSDVAFWGDMIKADFKGKDLLEKWADSQVNEEISIIESEMTQIIAIVVEFLDLLTPKIEKWIDKKEETK